MSEEYRYPSAAGDSHKRKYDDSPSPVARRGTGFSMAPDAAAPPPSYASVPPPMNEIELAKQKAQEIAARLLNNADPTKRARVDNGGGGGSGGGGFDSSDYGGPKTYGLGHSNPPPMASSGYPGSKKIEIPNGRVGVIIGKGGETIKYLQQQSGAKIQVTRDTDSDPNSTTRGVELMGTPDQISRAEQLITEVLAEAEAGSSGGGSRRMSGQPGAEQFVMKVPNNKVGLVIGKGGETIKNMQGTTGARIQVIPLHLPPGDTSNERTVQIDGTSEQIEAAKQLVEEVISENRMRNSSMSGGGYRQQGYQARPPTNWGQPPPMQQPGYGYSQAGPYPGQAPQYPPMNQPSYPGYPPQPASAGYPTGWDQSSAPANPQGAPGSATYDYYNQQPPQQQQPHHGSQDASGYNYGQAPQYSYGQDGYGGYHAGYGQPPTNPSSGYEQQQQQGYNSGYGSAPAAASSAPADANNPPSYGAPQGEATQGAAGYGGVAPPPTSQGGYGTNAGYGSYGQKPQQSPQSGYPPAAYGQGYPGGYGQQPYGAYYGAGGYAQQSGDGSAPAPAPAAGGGGGAAGGYEGGAAAAAATAAPTQGSAETAPPS